MRKTEEEFKCYLTPHSAEPAKPHWCSRFGPNFRSIFVEGETSETLMEVCEEQMHPLTVTGQSVRQQTVQTLMKTFFFFFCIFTRTHTLSVSLAASSLKPAPCWPTNCLWVCVYPAAVSHWWQCRVNYLRVQCWAAAWWLFKFTVLTGFDIQVRILVHDKIVCRGGERVCSHNFKKTKTNILKNKRRTGLNSFTASRYQYLYIIYSVFPTLSDDLIWILEDQNIIGFMSWQLDCWTK